MERKWRQEHDSKIAHFKNIYQQLLLAQGEAQKRAASEAEASKAQTSVLLEKLRNQISVQESRFEKGLEEVRPTLKADIS